MRENNENLLAGAWWVILNSLDFLLPLSPQQKAFSADYY